MRHLALSVKIPLTPHKHFVYSRMSLKSKLCFCFRIGGAMKQPSMASDLRTPEEEDNESMADYADGVGDGEMIIMILYLKPPKYVSGTKM